MELSRVTNVIAHDTSQIYLPFFRKRKHTSWMQQNDDMAKINDNMQQPDGRKMLLRIVAGLLFAGGAYALARTWGPPH